MARNGRLSRGSSHLNSAEKILSYSEPQSPSPTIKGHRPHPLPSPQSPFPTKKGHRPAQSPFHNAVKPFNLSRKALGRRGTEPSASPAQPHLPFLRPCASSSTSGAAQWSCSRASSCGGFRRQLFTESVFGALGKASGCPDCFARPFGNENAFEEQRRLKGKLSSWLPFTRLRAPSPLAASTERPPNLLPQRQARGARRTRPIRISF